MTATEAARIEWHRHIHEHGCSGWSWHCPASRMLYRAYLDAINRTHQPASEGGGNDDQQVADHTLPASHR